MDMKGNRTMRIGIGHDVHRLVAGRKLIIGGVDIAFGKGLLGHSDADVLVHAACDALLGAAGLGDIGVHFPDTDETYRDINSLILLEKINEMLRQSGYGIVNIDATVSAQAPKLSVYRAAMIKNFARVLHIGENLINIKFTTTEGLGVVGEGQGIAADCIALIKKTDGEKYGNSNL
jgi:2-C-methyl-D-erythritol 2,4-cyclodiphosphate synthase